MATHKLVIPIVVDAKEALKGFTKTSDGAKKFERDLGKLTRGAVAGSGAFQGMGRSIAFASSYFIGAAGFTALLTKSVEQATEQAAIQKQLAAQFKASGQELGKYQQQIDKATQSVSQLAGFEDDQLLKAFTSAFRASGDVTKSIRLQAVAADVARGRHIDLQQAMVALTRAYGGNVGSLRRLGITIPPTLKGMEAIEFVARKFAGQAKAGTTEQERFSAALANTEQIIGAQLLPTINTYLAKLSKWLNNTENQKKLADGLNGTLKVTGTLLGVVVHATEGWVLAIKKLQGAGALIPKPLVELFKAFAGGKAPGLTGPVGTAPSALPPGVVGPIGTAPVTQPSKRTGLHAQFVRTQLALAKAQVTESQADDRRILAEQAKLLKTAISQTSNLKKRKALYEQLGQVETQIRAIDAQAESVRKDARQKELDRRQKELDAQKAHLEKLKAQATALRGKIRQIRENFSAALDTARQGIGDLFTGPVLNPSDEARRRILGVGKPMSQDTAKLTADVRAQTAEFLRRQRDIAAIQKAAPKGLRGELGKELANVGIGTLDALAKKPGGFIKAFAARERAASSVAKVEMRAQLVTLHAEKLALHGLEVSMDGAKVTDKVTQQQQRKQKNNSASRRGRNAGTH